MRFAMTPHFFVLHACLFLIVGASSVTSAQHEAQNVELAGALSTDQLREDLDVFRVDFFARDKSFSNESRIEAEAKLASLDESLDTINRAQFELALAQIVALADNGHTMAFAGPRSVNYNRIDVRLTPFREDFYVLRTTTQHEDLLGAKLVAIDGVPVSELRDASRLLAGGISSWRDRTANYLLESPEQLHALNLIQNAEGATYLFETLSGETITRFLNGKPAGSERPMGGAGRWMYPELQNDEVGTWNALLSTSQAPWSLQDPNQPFRHLDMPELDAFVVELRQNHNAPGQPIRSALQSFAEAIENSGRKNLILDMRPNGGGDLNTTRNFMESLPELVEGRIFVLMSPWTFSAAISSIGYLKQTAPDRVTLVGEGPGDRLEFFSEGRVVHLPNTRAMLLYATERHDYQTGCEGKPDCHGSVVRHPIAVPTLSPDIHAPWTIEDYIEGRDPGMAAVKALIMD